MQHDQRSPQYMLIIKHGEDSLVGVVILSKRTPVPRQDILSVK